MTNVRWSSLPAWRRRFCAFLLSLLLFAALPLWAEAAQAARASRPAQARRLELSRAVRPWEYLGAVGTRAGIFGAESGRFEAWVYPLKILRNFTLSFHLADRVVPAERFARSVTLRPESCTILYAGDSFAVRQTLFVPLREPGAVMTIEVDTAEPLDVEAGFERDFQLAWPAGLGGTFISWNESLRAFALGEETKRFFALVGSPSAAEPRQEFFSNYASARQSSFKLGRSDKGAQQKVIVIAASFEGQEEAEKAYGRLLANAPRLQEEAAAYFQEYLSQTVTLKLPDAEVQQAYDWSRVSLLQGVVNNPFLGTGLIAGYRTSGVDARPGFAWFFGRDALWSALALTAAGDFATARTAIEFLARYQRADGKIPHEIAQSASFVRWFEDYPYGYASADATPLFLVVMNEYAVSSGDVSFVREKWTEIWKAYEYLRSTWDAQGLAQNQGVGHGWVEGGPLLPVKTEFYQSGLGIAALRALSNLARLAGKEDMRGELEREFARQRTLLNELFWIPEKKFFAFALDAQNRKIAEASVLATVPMWFGLLDEEKADAMIDQLADFDHAADWGMRILSSQSPKFGPSGYHFGAVWPLFTGWAAVGEYRYHRPLAAYANARANALLALDGALGRVTEILSGSYYAPLSVSTSHQIWSSAMVISPLLQGLLGLEVDAVGNRAVVSPHVPAGWDAFEVQNWKVGRGTFDLSYQQSPSAITLEVRQRNPANCVLEFSPAVSLRAKVVAVEINDRPAPFRVQTSPRDQHVVVRFAPYGARNTIRIRLQETFGVAIPVTLPRLGETSRNLKVISESWNAARDTLEMELSGLAGAEYEFSVWGSAQITHVAGAELVKVNREQSRMVVRFPGATAGYTRAKVAIQFGAKR